MRTAPIALADILEKDWQRDVVNLAKTLGWTRVFHTFDSRRSTHGFPDLVIVRDRVVYLELKREKTKLTDEQKGWLRALRAAHAEAYIARPRDLEALAEVLTGRTHYGLMPQHPHTEALQLHVDVASAIQRGNADAAHDAMLRIMQRTFSEMSSVWEHESAE